MLPEWLWYELLNEDNWGVRSTIRHARMMWDKSPFCSPRLKLHLGGGSIDSVVDTIGERVAVWLLMEGSVSE